MASTFTNNRIAELQSAPAQMKLLRAQHVVYDHAQQLLLLQLLLTVLIPVFGSVLAIAYPESKAIIAAIALVIVLLDISVLDSLQKSTRTLGAKVKEEFDCAVLGIEWNNFSVGEHPDPESIHAAAGNYREDIPGELDNWYPEAAAGVPLHMARLICQRTNVWYDSTLRRRVGGIALGTTILLSAVLLIVGIVMKLTLDSLILSAVVPVVPILTWGLREFLRQREAAAASERIKSLAQSLWARAREGACSPEECSVQARRFQDAIYERRCSAPVIFSQIYRRMRPRMEAQMRAGAEEMVRKLTGTQN